MNMAKRQLTVTRRFERQVLSAIPTSQLKLATIEDCRREMAHVYQDAHIGVADTENAR